MTDAKRRREVRFTCAKCDCEKRVDRLPSGWTILWDFKRNHFHHQCPDCPGVKKKKS